MSDDQFQGNSKSAKPAAGPPPEPVVKGEVIIRKKSIGKRFKAIFFGGDFKGAAKAVLSESVFPDARELIWDAFTGFGKKVIFPTGRDARRSEPRNMTSRTAYHNPGYHNYQSVMLPHQPPFLGRNARLQMDDIILPTREDCEQILEYLGDIIDKEKVCSKVDLNNALGRPSPFTDQKWGWFFLGNAEIVQIREGWLLDLPPAEPI